VLPPDVNASGTDFTVVTSEDTDTDAIRFGLTSIKNFGEGISEAILSERMANGPFASLADFLSRIASKSLNRKSLESLIKCGALDRFAARRHLLVNIETLLAFHRDATAPATQDSLFGSMMTAPQLMLPPATETTSLSEQLIWEKDLLGIYISGHPLDAHEAAMAKSNTTIAGLRAEAQAGRPVILPVLITEVRTLLTKKGDKMAFVKFEDKTDSIEGVIFPKIFKDHGGAIVAGNCLLVKATVSGRNGETSLSVENLKLLANE
jgi:DNA polymerase-3 subunit alpha